MSEYEKHLEQFDHAQEAREELLAFVVEQLEGSDSISAKESRRMAARIALEARKYIRPTPEHWEEMQAMRREHGEGQP